MDGAERAAAALVILISGPPAAGKTTIGRQVAHALGLLFVHRDGIKETLFDNLGWQDRAWSQKLGGASWDLLFYFAEQLLESGLSFVVESNFDPTHHAERIATWKSQYGYRVAQVHCRAEPAVLYQRFHQRAVSGERHPGHVDHLPSYAEFDAAHLQRDYSPLPVGGPTVTVDTTDWAAVDYGALCRALCTPDDEDEPALPNTP